MTKTRHHPSCCLLRTACVLLSQSKVMTSQLQALHACKNDGITWPVHESHNAPKIQVGRNCPLTMVVIQATSFWVASMVSYTKEQYYYTNMDTGIVMLYNIIVL